MDKWEYKYLLVGLRFDSEITYENLEEKLNILGEQGWEVTGFTGVSELAATRILLKRRKI